MPNDILVALQGFSRSLREGMVSAGQSKLDTAKLGLMEAEVGVKVRQEEREAELFPIRKRAATAQAEEAEIVTREKKQKEDWLNDRFDVDGVWGQMAEEGQWGPEQSMHAVEIAPDVGKAFGENVVMKRDERGAYYYDDQKGKIITNRDAVSNPMTQARMTAILEMRLDTEKFMQGRAAQGDKKAISALEEIKQDPLGFYQKEVQKKKSILNYAMRIGIGGEAIEVMKGDLRYAQEKALKFTMTPEQREEHDAKMQAATDAHRSAVQGLQNNKQMFEVHKAQLEEIQLLVLHGGFKLSPKDKAELDAVNVHYRNVADEYYKLLKEADFTKNKKGQYLDPGAIEKLNKFSQSLKELDTKRQGLFAKYPELAKVPAAAEVAGVSSKGAGGKKPPAPFEDTASGAAGDYLEGKVSAGEVGEVAVTTPSKRGGVKEASDRLYKLMTNPKTTSAHEHAAIQSFMATFPGEAGKMRATIARANIDRSPQLKGKYAEEIAASLIKSGVSVQRATKYSQEISNSINPNRDIKQTAKFIKGLHKELGFTEAYKAAAAAYAFLDKVGNGIVELAAGKFDVGGDIGGDNGR